MRMEAKEMKAGRTLKICLKGVTKTVTAYNVTKRLKNHQSNREFLAIMRNMISPFERKENQLGTSWEPKKRNTD